LKIKYVLKAVNLNSKGSDKNKTFQKQKEFKNINALKGVRASKALKHVNKIFFF